MDGLCEEGRGAVALPLGAITDCKSPGQRGIPALVLNKRALRRLSVAGGWGVLESGLRPAAVY
jgi:hypothetical protein